MASQERLEYFISAAFKDEGVRQAMQAFGKLNAESAKVVNELNRISDAGAKAGQKIRDSRTPYAQLGMQVNQLGTQVASGTSIFLAFSQQIGDVGWALQNAEGKLGAVGRVLAGPWGAAIAIAASVLGPFIAQLFEEEVALKKLDDAFALSAISAKALDDVNKLLAESNGNVQRSAYGAAVETRRLAIETLNAADAEIARLKAVQANKPMAMTGMMGVAASSIVNVLAGADIARLESTVATARKAIALQDATILHLKSTMDAGQRVQNAYTDGFAALQTELSQGRMTPEVFKKRHAELQKQFEVNTLAIKLEKDAQKESNREKREAAAAAKHYAAELKRQDNEFTSTTDWLGKQINLYNSESMAVGKAKNKLDEYNDALEKLRKIPGGAEWIAANDAALKKVASGITDEIKTKDFEDFQKIAESMTAKTLPNWRVGLDNLAEAYKKVDLNLHPEAVVDFANAVDALVGGPINDAIKKYDDLIAKANGVDDSFEVMRQQFVDSIAAAQQMGRDVSVLNEQLAILDQKHSELKIAERNAEIRKSFESIGMSVNDAFKGMLTAGMSWKDGMKGIINAVIDELWRLFVVQQIVGFVKNTLGGLFGGGGGGNSFQMPAAASVSLPSSITGGVIGKNANGTPSWQGGLTWVGERGPELVNLPRGAGVIPAHRASQMGSGGINITVDARGSADPAAVRAQVQQGILEAAPAIVAAAQQRTVAGLRRPRLGGAMQ